MKNIIVISAHPDDEILGCGGTLKKLSKLKKNVRVIFIAEGSSCRFTNYEKYKMWMKYMSNINILGYVLTTVILLLCLKIYLESEIFKLFGIYLIYNKIL